MKELQRLDKNTEDPVGGTEPDQNEPITQAVGRLGSMKAFTFSEEDTKGMLFPAIICDRDVHVLLTKPDSGAVHVSVYKHFEDF